VKELEQYFACTWHLDNLHLERDLGPIIVPWYIFSAFSCFLYQIHDFISYQ
jgi:hypothetical protein